MNKDNSDTQNQGSIPTPYINQHLNQSLSAEPAESNFENLENAENFESTENIENVYKEQEVIREQFAYLGSPRKYVQGEVAGNVRSSIDTISSNKTNSKPVPSTAIVGTIVKNDKLAELSSKTRPSYNFKMIKTDTISATPARYVLWTATIIIVIVSVMASLTNGILLVKDKIFSKDVAAQTGTSTTLVNSIKLDESEPRGSDDSRAGGSEQLLGFPPMYKVSNPDSLQSLGITAKGYYVADLKTGERILSKNGSDVFPIASVTKLMTALVAYEKMDLQKVVVVSRDSYNAYGAQGELVPGEKIKLGDLMYPVLMESSNDGAEVIAEAHGRIEFMAEMNKKAASLGMLDTYYEDPSGLNPKNVSSSEDLFKLTKYVKDKAPVLYDMTRVREFAILKHKWFNKNRFLNTELFTGGKNGYIDEAKWTTASTFEVTMAKGGKRPVGIVLLMSTNREGDATKLINFLQKNVFYTETGNF